MDSKSHLLIDTNVLIVTSACASESKKRIADLPVSEPALHAKIHNWLVKFSTNEQKLILSKSILNEYAHKLDEQDYARHLIMQKYQTSEWVVLDKDVHGHAILPTELESTIHDLADRKWVAASLHCANNGIENTIINACDTDWLDWTHELEKYGIQVYNIIEDWLRKKHLEKHK